MLAQAVFERFQSRIKILQHFQCSPNEVKWPKISIDTQWLFGWVSTPSRANPSLVLEHCSLGTSLVFAALRTWRCFGVEVEEWCNIGFFQFTSSIKSCRVSRNKGCHQWCSSESQKCCCLARETVLWRLSPYELGGSWIELKHFYHLSRRYSISMSTHAGPPHCRKLHAALKCQC